MSYDVHQEGVVLFQVKSEITKLRQAKEVTEREIESLLVPIGVSLECLALRERRRDGDLVRDYVEVLSQIL